MNIEQEYTELIKQCEQLDYSNIDTIFEYANNKLSKHSWELALVIMVNIFSSDNPLNIRLSNPIQYTWRTWL